MNKLSEAPVTELTKVNAIDLSQYLPLTVDSLQRLQGDTEDVINQMCSKSIETKSPEHIARSHQYACNESIEKSLRSLSEMDYLSSNVSVSFGSKDSIITISITGFKDQQVEYIYVDLLTVKFFDRQASFELAGFLNTTFIGTVLFK